MVSCNQGVISSTNGDSFWVVHMGKVDQVWSNIDGNKVQCMAENGMLKCCYNSDCRSFTCPGIVTSGSDQLLLIDAMRRAANQAPKSSPASRLTVKSTAVLLSVLLPIAALI
ncbi:hypothetical protein DL89DRAFT_263956 [Linderina pennispora]|uniref:Uncharacterized protein n=1 Tax=Linderina pennispora TaxID=61395 RepID=A0A1Y1WK82_9FUNG|nr:uncharacterized protein DL89DRAFT_263956 [Linderina pennispora]ORX73949.1 hypothetical protein DL89DRAFT_263956 [Linderina pennispora]